MATKEAIMQVMAVLADAFSKECSTTLLRIYCEALADLTDEQVESAAALAVTTLRFFPKVAELREFALGKSEAPNTSDRAIVAWTFVGEAVVRHGYRKTVQFDDPIIHAAIKSVGGWDQLCEKPQTEFDTFTRAAFLKAYEAFARSGIGDEQGLPCLGETDRQNLLNGFAAKPPIRVSTKTTPRIEGQRRNDGLIGGGG